ncbi:MAG: hypothetical protein Q9202_004091 [Teloschistes flavicans]
MARDILGPCLKVGHCALLHREPHVHQRQNNKAATRIWIGCQDIILKGEHHCTEAWQYENKRMRYLVMCFLGKFSQDTPLQLRLAMLQESEGLCRENLKGFQEWERYGQAAAAAAVMNYPAAQPSGYDMFSNGGNAPAPISPAYPVMQYTGPPVPNHQASPGMPVNGGGAMAPFQPAYPAMQYAGLPVPNHQASPGMPVNGGGAMAPFQPAYPAMQYAGPPAPNYQAHPGMPVNGGGAPAPLPPAYPAMQYTASPAPDHQAHPGLPVDGGDVCAPNPRARESTQRSVLNALAKGESTPAANRQARREVRANRGSAQAVMAEMERTERERTERERAEMERAKRAESAERKKAKMAERAKRANLRRLAERRDVEELPGKVKRVDGDKGEKGKGKEKEVDSGGNGEGLEDTDMDAVRRKLDWVDVDGEKNGGAGNSGGEKVKGKGTEKKVDSGYNAELEEEMDWFAVARALEEWDVGEYGGHLTDDA